MIKMIALDMDGTLFKDDKTIDEATKNKLLELQEQGVKIVLATGRTYRQLPHVAQQLNLKNGGYIIGLNGMEITDMATGESQIIGQMGNEEAAKIMYFAHEKNLRGIAFTYENFYSYMRPSLTLARKFHALVTGVSMNRGLEGDMHGLVHLKKWNQPIPEPVNKFVFVQNEKTLLKTKQAMMDAFPDLEVLAVGREWYEIMHKGISKGSGLLELADSLGITKDEIMCFGDAENDLAMIQAVKYGIAMGNAMDNVKAAAFDVTATNNEQGILKAINKYIDEFN